MPVITFQPSGISANAVSGDHLLDVARSVEVDIDAPCGGEGTCGKCMVRIVAGEVESDSLGALPAESVADGYVLACKTIVLDEDVTVQVPEKSGREGGRFVESFGDAGLVREELLPLKWEYDPLAIKWMIDVAPAQLEDGLSDFDRLKRAIQRDWGEKEIVCSLDLLRGLADTIRVDNGRVTVSMIRDGEKLHILRLEPSDCTVRQYGIAVDIGTTTIAVQLVFLEMGKIVATHSDYNDQISCGLDVISRINYSQKPERLEELRTRVLGSINSLISKAADAHDVLSTEICNAVVSGNTTMLHLLLGLKPEYIRLDPYTPTIMQSMYLTAEEVGIDINPNSWVSLSPCVGSYVGGDITAGLLCTDLATDTEDLNLFIDIGTNGEIVLGNCDFLMTCACSAGPSFEGGGIDCGMRAAIGAIERIEVDSDSGVCRFSTIGDTKPVGICGSGMIALLADLFLTGWIDAAGKLNRTTESSAIEVSGRSAFYIIASQEESGTGEALKISESEIENIIRTKGAIYSACSLMLQQVGMSFDDLEHIYIAGGFGRFLDLLAAASFSFLARSA